MKANLIAFSAVATFLVGIIVGAVVGDIPYLRIQKEVQLGAVLGSLMTAAITLTVALLIPYLVTKRMDDKKAVKQLVMNELELYLSEARKIRNVIEDGHRVRAIKEDEKMQIRLLFDYLDQKVDSIAEQMAFSFGEESRGDQLELEKRNDQYWKQLTSGDLMSADYKKVTSAFLRESLKAYCTFESAVRLIAHRVNKY